MVIKPTNAYIIKDTHINIEEYLILYKILFKVHVHFLVSLPYRISLKRGHGLFKIR